jgi:hypothetical protein
VMMPALQSADRQWHAKWSGDLTAASDSVAA